jgi:hypothetical protein
MMFLAHQSWYAKTASFRAGVGAKNGDALVDSGAAAT